MSNTLLTNVAGFALVLLAVALVPVLSARLRLPVPTLQAALGIALGTLLWATAGGLSGVAGGAATTVLTPLNGLVQALENLGAPGILTLFLPPLLFAAALHVDTRRLMADLGPILLLAIVAVVLTTVIVAAGVVVFTTIPLIWAVLLGALVATTDPSAVLGAFREVGAPRRLQALVEGESLLNDAAAIVLFVAVGGILISGVAPSLSGLGVLFLWSFLGGGALGVVIGHLGGLLVTRLQAHADAVVTVSLALPYLAFVLAELAFEVSGVVAVVLAGLLLGRALQSRVPPGLEGQVMTLWAQLANWAGALIVVGATVLMPVTLRPELFDVPALITITLGCLLARVLMLYGLLPLLAGWRISQPINHRYRLAMLWGGLRGAVTVALALTVAADPALPDENSERVAILACAFVLITLFVQAPTLPLLLRGLRLAGLSSLDRVLQEQASRAVELRLAERAGALRIGLGLDMAEEDTPPAAVLAAEQRLGAHERRERIIAAIAGLTEREAELYREYYDAGIVDADVAPALLRGTRALSEALRSEGLAAYTTMAKRELTYDRALRLRQWVYRRLRWRGPLARALAQRYELILVRRSALIRLRRDVADELALLMDEDAATRVDTVLRARLDAHQKAIEALRQQYPSFAQELETRFLKRATLRLELDTYRELRDDGLLSGAAFNELSATVGRRRRQSERLPRLDLRIDRGTLLDRIPHAELLDKRTRRRLRRALRPAMALPGDRLIRRGMVGDRMFFIANGAVAVQWNGGRRTLGSGDVIGEIAILTGQRRTADVIALTYVQYLVLHREDFMRITADARPFRASLSALAATRERERLASAPVSRETEVAARTPRFT